MVTECEKPQVTALLSYAKRVLHWGCEWTHRGVGGVDRPRYAYRRGRSALLFPDEY